MQITSCPALDSLLCTRVPGKDTLSKAKIRIPTPLGIPRSSLTKVQLDLLHRDDWVREECGAGLGWRGVPVTASGGEWLQRVMRERTAPLSTALSSPAPGVMWRVGD
eukprot:1580643-Rhodomonas_salina.1